MDTAEGYERAEQAPAEAQGAAAPPEAAAQSIEQQAQRLIQIARQEQTSDKQALAEIAVMLLDLIGYKPKAGDPVPVTRGRGRNVVPGAKTGLAASADVPAEIAFTHRSVPVAQWEIDEARAREKFAAEGGDPELLRVAQQKLRDEVAAKARAKAQDEAAAKAKEAAEAAQQGAGTPPTPEPEPAPPA